MARTNSGKLFDALAIRDTDAHNATAITDSISGDVLLVSQNTCDEEVTVVIQGSVDGGTTWHDLDSQTLAATTGKDTFSVTAPWKSLRAKATASAEPASGSLTVYWVWSERR